MAAAKVKKEELEDEFFEDLDHDEPDIMLENGEDEVASVMSKATKTQSFPENPRKASIDGSFKEILEYAAKSAAGPKIFLLRMTYVLKAVYEEKGVQLVFELMWDLMKTYEPMIKSSKDPHFIAMGKFASLLIDVVHDIYEKKEPENAGTPPNRPPPCLNVCVHEKGRDDRMGEWCAECGKTVPSVEAHFMRVHRKQWGVQTNIKCGRCCEQFRGDLAAPEICKKCQDAPFVCPICTRRFTKATLLSQHIQAGHDNINLGLFGCSKCEKEFKTSINLEAHLHSAQCGGRMRMLPMDKAKQRYKNILARLDREFPLTEHKRTFPTGPFPQPQPSTSTAPMQSVHALDSVLIGCTPSESLLLPPSAKRVRVDPVRVRAAPITRPVIVMRGKKRVETIAVVSREVKEEPIEEQGGQLPIPSSLDEMLEQIEKKEGSGAVKKTSEGPENDSVPNEEGSSTQPTTRRGRPPRKGGINLDDVLEQITVSESDVVVNPGEDPDRSADSSTSSLSRRPVRKTAGINKRFEDFFENL